VLRYRFFLEQKNLAPSTINVRLAAVRRLAYEAADTGLLNLELAAGIARVKGAKRLGVRIGNWLTAEQGKALLRGSCSDAVRGKREREDPAGGQTSGGPDMGSAACASYPPPIPTSPLHRLHSPSG
jgi:hypothetical protein